MHFSVLDPNEQLARGTNCGDNVDLEHSPKDNAIVAVAMANGVKICWYCFEQFDDYGPKEGVEVAMGEYGTRIKLHRRCVGKKPREQRQTWFNKVVRQIQEKALIRKVAL